MYTPQLINKKAQIKKYVVHVGHFLYQTGPRDPFQRILREKSSPNPGSKPFFVEFYQNS